MVIVLTIAAFVGLLAVVVAAVLGTQLVGARRSALSVESLRDDLGRITEQQRELSVSERDAAVSAALQQLSTMHQRLAEQERVLGTRELAGQRALIEQQIDAMRLDLGKVGELVHTLERDREQKFGELANELKRQNDGVAALAQSTQQLRDTLSSARVRGQWGERMAEDVLRLAGFVEGVQYRKQRAAEATTGRPDFTFLLPNDLVMYMDVKFPLDNYVRHLEAHSDIERRQTRDQFLRDVRDRVNELTTRGYLDGAGVTVDCLLLFIPNEQVYAFVQEHAPEILDHALTRKIVLCSPLTLYAVLAVVRQAVDNFRLERTSNEILELLGQFSVQWDKYLEASEVVQRKLDSAAKAFSDLSGTRARQLQRPLDKIDALRRTRDLDAGDAPAADILALEA